MISKHRSRWIACIMCAVLLASTMYGLFGAGVGFASPAATGAVARDLEDVTGKYSLDEIRESLYSDDVQVNTFTKKGKGNVIIRVEGQSISDRYGEKNPTADFSDYAASSEGARLARGIAARQQKVLAAMDRKGIDYTLLYSYTAVANAFAVKMDYEDIAAVRKIDGVADAYITNTYAVPKYTVASNNAHVYNTGIYNPEGVEETGKGMKVAILDTGLDYTHTAFQEMPEGEDVWTENDIAGKLDNAMSSQESNVKWMAKQLMPSVTAQDVYVNAKVPYAFDYADNDANVYPSYSSHGTHVAGIVAGKDEGKHVNENDENETFIGVAPDAQLVIMKVFTDDLDDEMLGGADTADILAALNDCAILGVDVINMSLGSTGGFTSSNEEVEGFLTGNVYEAIKRAGISLIVAAGNESSSGSGGGNGMNLASDPDSGTVSSPSTYDPSLSVASINGAESPYALANSDKGEDKESVAFITNAADLNSNDIEFVDLMMEKYKDRVENGKLTLNYVVVSGVGRIADYTGTVRRALSRPGTIALVRRGDISFSEKVQNAMSAGASGVMIYNNLSGEIRMSLADLEDPIPACSIDLNAGTAMVNNATGITGTITFSKEFTAGPFMSSFSGLGVTPDLKLKPEITAHGGEIWSAVPGGYDTYSGTSMASPNMAGAVALLRQHFKDTTQNAVELNALVYQRLMSTATIANNPDNNPYSPRKQGAGLADIKNAINSDAFLRVPDKENGGYKDKTKLEYGDDVDKTGVYTMDTFTLTNAGAAPLTYSFDWDVFTETLAINKRTVEENAYMLNDSVVTFTTSNGIQNGERGTSVTVPAGGNVDITVTVRLSQAAKAYLNESFANGMYVEGYFRLRAADPGISLSIPFLAFYGDWQQAPLFDYSMYELAVTDADSSIEDARKPKASARATTPLGLFNDGVYIIPLGSYLYEQDEDEVQIYPSSEKAAISRYDETNRRTIYELYMIYGGLLRGAKTMQVTVTDAVTGEVVYDKTEKNVRKAYAGSGANVGAPIDIEMHPARWGLANNREYVFKMQGTLDWKDGKANKDTFEFNFFVDYEAPRIDSYSVRFDPYTENKETKYRIYLDVNVYDNRFAQDLLPCYVKDNKLTLLTEYAVPVYSSANSITQVSIDITDIYDDYYDEIYLGVEDYALNQSLYHLNLTNATKYCDTVKFAPEDGKFTQTDTRTGSTVIDGKDTAYTYDVYSLTLAPNEAYTLLPTLTPSDTYSYKLTWSSSNEEIAVGYENQIFAKKEGSAVISVKDGNGLTKAQIRVKVAGEAKRKPLPDKLTLRPVTNKGDYVQSLAQSGTTLELYPATRLQLEVESDPWYVRDGLELVYTSSDQSIVSVDENGLLTVSPDKRGVVTVTVYAKENERIRASVRVRVVSSFRIVNYTLYDYHGPSDVVIPDELNVMYLDEEAFQNNTDITSIVLPKTLSEIPEEAFKGCTGLKTVTLPSATTTIGKNAFEGCVGLETLILKTFTDEKHPEVSEKYPDEKMIGAVTVGNFAFSGCIKLKNIVNQLRLTTIGAYAFSGCESLTSLDLRNVAVAYRGAFENCTGLTSVLLSSSTAASANMFEGCEKLAHIYAAEIPKEFVDPDHPELDATLDGKTETYPMRAVADGMFSGCVALQNITFTSALRQIGENAFRNSGLTSVTLNSAVSLGSYAFADCEELAALTIGANAALTVQGTGTFAGSENLTNIAVDSGNTTYSVKNNVLYANNKEVVVIPASVKTLSLSGVTKVGNGAFADMKELTSIDLSGVEEIGEYAFRGTGLTSVVLPASLTKIGMGAFRDCASLTQVTWQTPVSAVPSEMFRGCAALFAVQLPDTVTEVGYASFYGCAALANVTLGKSTERIGASAFEGTAQLKDIALPDSVRYIGARAFAGARGLTEVVVPAVTDMGAAVFAECGNIAKLTFKEGATFIGAYLFSGASSSALKTLVIPSSVTVIDEGAFLGCALLQEINPDNTNTVNLNGVIVVGDLAFARTGLQTVRLPVAKIIGDMAFSTSRVERATLDSVENIGAMAFFGAANLTVVTFPCVKTIGANAFTGTRLDTVKLPASFDSYTYELTMNVRMNSGEYEDQTICKESMGAGAFADVYVTDGNRIWGSFHAINVDKENPVFFDDDGVLYAKVKNGYTLVQYPVMRKGKEYTVLDGTVRIEPSAFSGAFYLEKVYLPASLKSIGSGAFYMTDKLTEYVFAGVQAPTLDSDYVDANEYKNSTNVLESLLYRIFATEDNLQLGSQTFYNNFYYYVAIITEEKNLNESGLQYKAPSFNLSICYPENGVGYDNTIWSAFFEKHTLSAYAADDITIAVNAAIAALPTEAQIAGANSVAELDALHYGTVDVARALYNTIADAKQLALVTDYAKLCSVESAVRAARTRLGSPARVQSLRIASAPNKQRYYENETLNTEGLRVIAVYDDATEEEVTAYTLDKTGALALSDEEVHVSYQGATALFHISVTRYIEYTVSFAGSGVKLKPVKVEANTLLSIADPTRKGYRFGGWTDEDGDAFDITTTAITKDMTLTAQWIKTGGATKKKCGGNTGAVSASLAATLCILFVAIVLTRRVKGKKA